MVPTTAPKRPTRSGAWSPPDDMSGGGRTGASVAMATALAVAVLASGVTTATADETPAPGGYRITYRNFPAPGVEHLRLVRDGEPLTANVARISPGAPVRLRTVLSNDRIAGPAPTLERTSQMCRRTNCIVAINGDFFNGATGEPAGALVRDGQLLRSPVGHVQQVMVDAAGRLTAGPMVWSGVVEVPGDLSIGIDAVNVSRPRDKIVLYTGHWAPSTGTNATGAEILLRIVSDGGPAGLGHALQAQVLELRAGNTAIPPDAIVLSATGAATQALRDFFWAATHPANEGARVVLKLDAEGAPVQSLGGTPVLSRDSQREPLPATGDFATNRHPRTLVGRTENGTVLLVAVDGRQPGYSVGMTLAEAQEFMEALGAVEAINLDGGGSTTFVAHRIMINRASDQLVARAGRYVMVRQPSPGDIVVANIERPVAEALTVVPA